MAARFITALSRKKSMIDNEESKLARVLSLLDLTGLGVGSTLGLGVYVLAGSVAKTVAGPAVCISFLIAAIASAFAGLCYAEFAARVPKAGSAYVYSYVSVGEFVAYIIGWNLILEYVIGTASLARGLSNYVDALANFTMRDAFSEAMPIDVSFLAPYPDFLSFLLVIVVTVFLAIGVKESTTLNNILTGLNLITVSIVIVSGSIKADPKNWAIDKEDIPSNVENAGNGGFAPFGFSGIMAGAAKCFFGFVGFDAIATTGEEAKNPQRNIPLSILISLIIIFCAYFGIAIVLTMMWPYYDQDADAPFPHVFEMVDWIVIKWIVTVGAIFALCTSLMGAMFPLPRVLYAMGKDGVLFTFLQRVHPKTKTPLLATIIAGLLAGIMAVVFDLQQLIDMMSIGTLLAYTIVAICVLILRYENENPDSVIFKHEKKSQNLFLDKMKLIGNLNMNKVPDSSTSAVTKWALTFYIIAALTLSFTIKYASDYINFDYPFAIVGIAILGVILVLTLVIIGRQPTSDIILSFKVPWVPVIPCLSILMNLYLMAELDYQTWIRFLVWLVIGFLIYFLYGITHSVERYKVIPNEQTTSGITVPDNKVVMETKSSEESGTTKF
ncbi:hypothetical protein FQR65_LT12021 [Abscondita terminalis]|nr:hypothetical protein FQR65_LT12021 [Abscondita terminalis]